MATDEFGNAHFQTGIPMNGYECAHVECPTWRILTNPKGRVELYGTGDGIPGVAVLWDSLDAKAPNDTAVKVMRQLAELRDAINLLLAKADPNESVVDASRELDKRGNLKRCNKNKKLPATNAAKSLRMNGTMKLTT